MYSCHHAHIRTPIFVWSLRLILIGILGSSCLSAAQEKLKVDLIETVTQAKQAVDENPTSTSAHLNLGFAYLELGSMQQAEAEFKSVVSLDPRAPSGYYWLGGVYFLQSRYEEAIDVFQRALEQLPGWSAAYHGLGMSHFERHNLDAAEIAFNRALNLMQKPQSSQYEVLAPSFGTGGYGWNIKPSPANALYFLGLIESQRGSLDKAKEYWRQAIKTGPSLAEVYFELGVAYNKDKRWEKSVRVLREAIRLRPEMPAAHYQLARAYLKLGKTTEGTRELEEFQRLKTAYARLGARHTMIRAAPDAAITLFGLARNYMQEEKYAEAGREFQKALWHDPRLAKAYSGLGRAYVGLGRLDDAFEALGKALELEPNLAEAYITKGLILLTRADKSGSRSDYESAVSACRRGIELNPKLQVPIVIRVTIGKAYLQEGELTRASRQFEEILKTDANFSDAYFYLGAIHLARHEYEKAESAYLRVIELDPSSANAYERLAHLYGTRGILLDEAIQYAEKAIDLKPDSAAYYNTLSWLHFLGKDYEKSETSVIKALELDPDNQLYSEGLKVIRKAKQSEDGGKKVGK